MRKPTERQKEFRAELGQLLAGYAKVVGPAFDGEEEGEPAEFPVATRWLLIAEWDDAVVEENGPYVILCNSGITWVDQLGLLHAAKTMVEGD